VSQKHRSRDANRRAAVERFVELLEAAIARKPPRTPTRATRAARERRLQEKKERSLVKRGRSRFPAD